MSNEDTRPSEETVPSEQDVSSEEGAQEKVSEKPEDGDSKDLQALSLTELNELTGRKYKSKEDATKSIQDTFSHVGKRKENIAEEMKKEGEVYSKEEVDALLFYRDNQDLQEYRPILDALAQSRGISVSEAAELDEFKGLVEKASGFEEVQKKKTVMDSKSRLAEDSSYKKDFEKAQETGDWGSLIVKHHMQAEE